jgi:hypothetical protein
MQRTRPLIAPATITPERTQRAAHTLATNVQQLHSQLDRLADRLARAVTRTTATSTAAPPPSPPHQPTRTAGPLRPISAALQRRAERHILHLALHTGRASGLPTELQALQPEDFTTTRHANLWRTIQDLHNQGLPINYVSVFHATRAAGFPHSPMPTERSLTRMAQPPETTPDRITRSLRILTTAALTRATKHTQRTLNTLAADTSTPVDTLLNHAKTSLDALATHANTTAGQPATTRSHRR